MSFIIQTDTTFKEIKQGDVDFYMTDGIKLVPRASLEVSEACPLNIKLAIQRAMADGYLRPVAYIKTKDYMWEQLGG